MPERKCWLETIGGREGAVPQWKGGQEDFVNICHKNKFLIIHYIKLLKVVTIKREVGMVMVTDKMEHYLDI